LGVHVVVVVVVVVVIVHVDGVQTVSLITRNQWADSLFPDDIYILSIVTAERQRQGINQELRQETVPLPICTPQIQD
jgi:hypothetical protein